MRRILFLTAVVFSSAACTHAQAPVKPVAVAADPATGLIFADPSLGFDISRPQGDQWKFTPGEASTASESVAVPVVVAHRGTGAQVVVQVAPAVSTPEQFAERLTRGLRARPGFTTTEVEPITVSDGAVGFAFTMGDQVAGRVAVVGGNGGKVYVLLATWPQDAPPTVITGVDEIVKSLHTTSAI